MFISLVTCGCATTGNTTAAQVTPGGPWLRLEKDGITLHYQAPDENGAEQLGSIAARARSQVESFFGASFPSPLEVYVYPDRQSLTDRWRRQWSMPDFQAQCWMAAAASAKGMTLLSPRVWASQACEHDASNAERTQALVTHELMHAFHAQHLPPRSFDGLEDIEWFAEGLATYVSGQLELGYLAPAAEAIAAGKAPAKLRSAHSGKYRYGICGSLVRFVHGRVGRAKLLEMLRLETTEELLAVMGLTEQQFLASWEAAVLP